jgi:hypothetical protein
MFKSLTIAALMVFAISAQATTGDYLDTSSLSDVQKAELALKVAKLKGEGIGSITSVGGVLDNLNKFEGIGRETGVAIREGLNAVTEVAGKFGETKVGQITIALIVWRIVGRDLMLVLLGAVGLIIGIWFYRRSVAPTVIIDGYEYVPMLWGFWTKQAPSKVTTVDATDEMKVVGIVGLIIGVGIMVIAIANI